ncbi:hypothetical protein FACS1894159_10390 [Bacteroidia bacterium]|nr:hypothetical protein FACS1894159_10390 [Bacteroidia bacterium]
MPQINAKEARLRKRYFGEKFLENHPNANPDFKIGGRFVEYKSTNRRGLSYRIKEASIQADIAVVRITEPITENYLSRFMDGQWMMKDRLNLREIILYVNGELRIFKRP